LKLMYRALYQLEKLLFVFCSVDENSSLKSVLEKHFAVRSDNTATLHQLCNFHRQPISNLKLFLQKEPSEVGAVPLLPCF
jgi:hypothetical protein